MADQKYNYHPLQMFKHIDENQCYASTLFIDETNNTKHYIHWGTVDEKNVFIPNDQFCSLSDIMKKMFIYPDDWDMSIIGDIEPTEDDFIRAQKLLRESLNHILIFNNKSIETDDLYFMTSGQYFLQILFNKHDFLDILTEIFDYASYAPNTILHSAGIIELLHLRYAPCVKIVKTQGSSTAKVINDYLKLEPIQKINDDVRINFIKRNLYNKNFDKNFDKLDIVYVAFYTEFKLTADIDDEQSAIVEAIAYLSETHEPFYYNVFSSDEVTLKIIYSVKSDLSNLGFDNILLLLDKRDAYNDNIIGKLISDNISFIFVQENMSKEIYSHISKIEYDEYENPIDMQYCELDECYGKQIDLSGKEYKLNDRETIIANDYKCNIYVTPSSRLRDLDNIESTLEKERKLLDEKISSGTLKDEYEEINECLKYHRIDLKQEDGQDIFEIVIKSSLVRRDKICAGTHELITHQVYGDAERASNIYKLKLDQDNFLRRIRYVIERDIKDYDYKNINEQGKRLVLFFALFIHIKILYTYRNSEKLKDFYNLTSIINKMQSLSKNINKSPHIIFSSLTKEQKEIFNEFDIHITDLEF